VGCAIIAPGCTGRRRCRKQEASRYGSCRPPADSRQRQLCGCLTDEPPGSFHRYRCGRRHCSGLGAATALAWACSRSRRCLRRRLGDHRQAWNKHRRAIECDGRGPVVDTQSSRAAARQSQEGVGVDIISRLRSISCVARTLGCRESQCLAKCDTAPPRAGSTVAGRLVSATTGRSRPSAQGYRSEIGCRSKLALAELSIHHPPLGGTTVPQQG